jgi:enoyl-CoA hydratase
VTAPGSDTPDTGTDDHLLVTDNGSVRILRLNRPKARNAMHAKLRVELKAAISAADRDAGVTAIVLTGTDPVFSAGVDFKNLEPEPGSTGSPLEPTPAAAIRAVRKPVIAAVNGACVSGALELALSCSFIVASDRASFADTHARLGVVPTWGLTALLPRAVGIRKAREMSLTGAFVGAQEALRLGLVNQVVDHDDLLTFTLDLAARIPANGAVGEFLELYDRGADLSLSAALNSELTHSLGRTYDLAAFTAAGTAISGGTT